MNRFNLPLIMLLFVGTFLISSCSDDTEVDLCQEGTVRFTNNSSDPYDLYINGVYRSEISGNTFMEYDLPEGQHSARVEQVSGFVLFQTTRETTLNVFGCQDTSWVFP
jgi:hypothetical protein